MDYIRPLIEKYPTLTPIRLQLDAAYRMLEKCFESGGKLLIGGNGGSAADSEHIVGELMKSFVKKREIPPTFSSKLKTADSVRGTKLAASLQGALPAIAITGHAGLTTAFANDVDPLMTYAQQVYGYGNAGDVLLAISTSGNAENLMYAAVTAKAKGMRIIALTGKDGGKLARISDVAVIVPEHETYEIQELHLPIYHALCLQLEDHFFS
jgi:D-sedoheptulose 7-phosphate isomerase